MTALKPGIGNGESGVAIRMTRLLPLMAHHLRVLPFPIPYSLFPAFP